MSIPHGLIRLKIALGFIRSFTSSVLSSTSISPPRSFSSPKMGFISVAVVVVAVLYVIRKILTKYWGTADRGNEEDVTNKIVLITGANAGIGKATAQEMADRGAVVVMACRNMDAANAAIIDIRKSTGNGKLIPMKLDLGSLESIRDFANEFQKKFDKIHILINNAGVALDPALKLKTKDGFEYHFGVNHLGHFLLTNLLVDCVKRAAPSRIVVVSSMAHNHGKIDFGDLMMENSKVEMSKLIKNNLYFNSKLANALFSQELSKRLWGTNVNVYCLCPGIVRTDIIKTTLFEKIVLKPLLSFIMKSPRQGCQTTLHCALSKSVRYETGQMYQNCRKWHPQDRITLRHEVATKLWDVSEEYVGLKK